MAAPITNPYPPAPLLTDSGEVFDAKAFDFADSLEPRRQELQTQADWVGDRTQEATSSAQVATAVANFAGKWSSLTGAQNKGISVEHNGSVYMLVNDLADVTLSEPTSQNTDWFEIGYSASVIDLLLDDKVTNSDAHGTKVPALTMINGCLAAVME